jgi:hypothetical protein
VHGPVEKKVQQRKSSFAVHLAGSTSSDGREWTEGLTVIFVEAQECEERQ